RVQKPRGQLGVTVAALTEQPRDDRRHIQRRGQFLRRGVVGGYGFPPWRSDRHLHLARLLRIKSANTEGTDTNGASTRLIHGNTTNSILSAAYRVHSRLGPGLLERPYRECLRFELTRMGARVECEKILPVVYEGLTIELGYRIDMLVDDLVIVEIKS